MHPHTKFERNLTTPPEENANVVQQLICLLFLLSVPSLTCKSFTFYEVVRWHFSGVVGEWVPVCFLLT